MFEKIILHLLHSHLMVAKQERRFVPMKKSFSIKIAIGRILSQSIKGIKIYNKCPMYALVKGKQKLTYAMSKGMSLKIP